MAKAAKAKGKKSTVVTRGRSTASYKSMTSNTSSKRAMLPTASSMVESEKSVAPSRPPKYTDMSCNYAQASALKESVRSVFNCFDRVGAGRLTLEDAETAARAAGLFFDSSKASENSV